MKCSVACLGLLLLVCGSTVAQNEDIDLESLISGLFTPPPPTTNQGIQPAGNTVTIRPVTNPNPNPVPQPRPVNVVNTCQGECVPYFLCNNNTINTDGSGLIDIRIDDAGNDPECQEYLETCCAAEDKITTPIVPPVVNPQTGCGFRNEDGAGFRISGDKDNEAQFGEFPWMMAILREERVGTGQPLNTYQCGGSLIHESVVLTAAHCVADKVATTLKVRAGEWDTQTRNELYVDQNREVVRMIVHPQYTKSNLVNDVALLFLAQPFEKEPHISTVCLPPQDTNFDRSNCVASGWGKDVFGRDGKYQVILKKVEMPMVNFNQCQNSLRTTRLGRRFQLSPTFVCAGGEVGKDTCKGDGGSPLVCPIQNRPGQYYQSGIVAWGIGCGENQIPGVYVNVAKFRNWIDTEMRKANLNTQSYTA